MVIRADKLVLFVFLQLLVIIWGYASLLEWRSARLLNSIEQNEVSSTELLQIKSSYWADPYLYMAGILYSEISIEPDIPLQLLKRASQNRPLSPFVWLSLADWEFRAGNLSASKEYTDIAYQIVQQRPKLQWNLIPRYLQLNDKQTVLQIIRNYAVAYPKSIDSVLGIAIRIEPDHEKFASYFFTSEQVNRSQDKGAYYKSSLFSAMKRQNVELTAALWAQLPKELYSQIEWGNHYLDFMFRHGNKQLAINAWQDMTGEMLQDGIINNPGFESEVNVKGACWRIIDAPGFQWALDSEEILSGNASLKVEFSGEENLHFLHVSCYVPVEPLNKYKISGYWRGREISTLSGMYVSLAGLYAPELNIISDIKRGDWDWQKFEMTFVVPESVDMAAIRLRRNKTDLLDNKLAGKVWLDEIKLEKLTNYNEQVDNE